MTQFKLVSNPHSQEFIIAIPALGNGTVYGLKRKTEMEYIF